LVITTRNEIFDTCHLISMLIINIFNLLVNDKKENKKLHIINIIYIFLRNKNSPPDVMEYYDVPWEILNI